MTHVLSIQGMRCGGCVEAADKAARAVAGVEDIRVDLEQHRAELDCTCDPAEVAAAITQAGYPSQVVA